jgi:hypothetical protein
MSLKTFVLGSVAGFVLAGMAGGALFTLPTPSVPRFASGAFFPVRLAEHGLHVDMGHELLLCPMVVTDQPVVLPLPAGLRVIGRFVAEPTPSGSHVLGSSVQGFVHEPEGSQGVRVVPHGAPHVQGWQDVPVPLGHGWLLLRLHQPTPWQKRTLLDDIKSFCS